MSAELSTDPHVESKDPVYERQRRIIFVVTWLAYAGFYLTRKSFSAAKAELDKGSVAGWSFADMAWVDGAYLTTYAIGQFVCGIGGDRLGTRRVILTGMGLSILVAVTMGATSSVWLLAALFAVQGFCQSSGWAPLAKNMSEFFSVRERGTVIGLWSTNYAAGGFIASLFAGFAISAAYYFGASELMAWRYAFWIPAAVLSVIWLLFYLLQRNRPEDCGLPPIEVYHSLKGDEDHLEDSSQEDTDGSWGTILEVLRNRKVLLLAAVYFFLKPTRYLVLFSAALYASNRLEESGISSLGANLIGGMFDLAGPIGVLLGGVASDYVFRSRRIPPSVISLVLLSVFLFVFPQLPRTPMAIGGGFFVIGFLLYLPDSLVSCTAAIDFATKKGASTAAGFVNGCGSVGAIVGGTMPGWIEAVGATDSGDIWTYVFWGLSVSTTFAALLLLPCWNVVPSDS